MSLLDKAIAAITPPGSDDDGSKARAEPALGRYMGGDAKAP